MGKKRYLISSIIMFLFGICGIIAFAILFSSGENMFKWIGALIVAIISLLLGIVEMLEYKGKL